jgi:peptidoglycan-associated lipoprotein
MTRAPFTITLLFGLALSACSRDSARQEEEASQAAADSARVAADSAQRVAAADSVQRAQELARITETMGERIGFAFDRSTIRAADRPILDRKVELLRADPSIRIQIAGHCDIRGPDRYNQALGTRRAEAAKQYLTRAGIAADRIDVVSYGETQPLDPGTTREAHARNRRAEFTIVGGGPATRR